MPDLLRLLPRPYSSERMMLQKATFPSNSARNSADDGTRRLRRAAGLWRRPAARLRLGRLHLEGEPRSRAASTDAHPDRACPADLVLRRLSPGTGPGAGRKHGPSVARKECHVIRSATRNRHPESEIPSRKAATCVDQVRLWRRNLPRIVFVVGPTRIEDAMRFFRRDATVGLGRRNCMDMLRLQARRRR